MSQQVASKQNPKTDSESLDSWQSIDCQKPGEWQSSLQQYRNPTILTRSFLQSSCIIYNELSNSTEKEKERGEKKTRDALSSVIPTALGWAPRPASHLIYIAFRSTL